MTQDSQGAYRVGGRYPLGEAFERRGIGDLYWGIDDQTGAPVQILLASPHLFPQPWMGERALAELGRISQSTHPNLVRLLGGGVLEDGRLYVVSEVPPGPTLAASVGSAGPLPWERALPLFEQLADALDEGRRLGVWHRDLSPSNVFVSPDLRSVKLHYFGLAEPISPSALGDPWFMAPEQVSGGEPDEQRLVYGLGALWYYLACGQPVFLTDDAGQAMQMHLVEPPQPPSAKRPDLGIPPALDALLLACLAKSPLGRPAGLAGFLAGARALKAPAPRLAPAPAPQAVPAFVPQPSPRAAQGDSSASGPVSGRQSARSAPASHARPAHPEVATPSAASQTRRRKKKPGFRETLWFKKGDAQDGEGDEVTGKELAEVRSGDGSIADAEQGIDERYRDDGSVNAEDRRQYSIKTGHTQRLQAVRSPRPMDPRGLPDPGRKRARMAWVLILLLLLGGGGAAAGFFLLQPTESFVPSHLGMTLAAQVSDYKVLGARKFLPLPALRDLPKGEDRQLFAKLRETVSNPETLLPRGVAGAVDYLAALERRRANIDKENAGLPPRKQISLWKILHRRNYRAAERDYGQLRARIVADVMARLVEALKTQKEQPIQDAKAACLQLLDSGDLGPDRAALEGPCKALDVHFGLGEDTPSGVARERPPEERPRPVENRK